MSKQDLDRETTGLLLGLGTGITLGISVLEPISTVVGITIGNGIVLLGLAYEIYQRTTTDLEDTDDANQ